MMQKDVAHRKYYFLHNVVYLLLALLTYIIFQSFLYRNSLPIQERAAVQQQRQHVVSANAANEKIPVVTVVAKEVEELSVDKDDLVFQSHSHVSLQRSPGVVWLMSFGGSVC